MVARTSVFVGPNTDKYVLPVKYIQVLQALFPALAWHLSKEPLKRVDITYVLKSRMRPTCFPQKQKQKRNQLLAPGMIKLANLISEKLRLLTILIKDSIIILSQHLTIAVVIAIFFEVVVSVLLLLSGGLFDPHGLGLVRHLPFGIMLKEIHLLRPVPGFSSQLLLREGCDGDTGMLLQYAAKPFAGCPDSVFSPGY